jgi:hypothetical protein
VIDLRIGAVMVMSAALAAPAAAAAQTGTYGSTSFTASHTYESNLFAKPESLGPEADFISQIGPSVIAGYQSLPFEFAVNYGILAERYQRHTELNDAAARQQAGLTLRYRPRERFAVHADASYISTQTPAEFNLQSGLDVGRAPAARFALASTATFKVTPAAAIDATYALDRDVMVGHMTSTTQRVRAGIGTRTGIRNAYRLDYEVRQFAFSAGAPIASHAVLAGWVHELTQRLGYDIAVGPRLSGGSLRPDLSTRLRWRSANVDLLLSYVRTDMTAIGELGTFDVQAMSTGITYRPRRRMTVGVTPLLSRNSRGRQHVMVYTLGAESTVAVTRRLSLGASARFSRQDGTLAGPRHVIANRRFGLQLTFSPLRNDRDVTDR